MHKFRIEYEKAPIGTVTLELKPGLSLQSTRRKASKMSREIPDDDLWPRSIYLIGSDANGYDQAQYCYFDGELTSKDLVSDWD
jgi:hypothetical protein